MRSSGPLEFGSCDVDGAPVLRRERAVDDNRSLSPIRRVSAEIMMFGLGNRKVWIDRRHRIKRSTFRLSVE